MMSSSDTHPIDSGKLQVETDDAIDYFGEERYENSEAAIRELLANAVTGCFRAREEHSVVDPEIRIEFTGDEFIIKDQGCGISSQKFKEDVAVVANRGSSQWHGKYGIGQLAARLLGPEYTFETYSRETGESYAVKITADNTIEPQEGGREYPGTTVRVPVDNGLSEEDVRSTVEKYVDIIPFDVLVVFPEDQEYFPGTDIDERYEDGVVYEDEFVIAAVNSENSSNRIYAEYMPVKTHRHYEDLFITGWPKVDIILKDNDGPVIAGEEEHIGKIPVSKSRYDPEKNHILKSELTDEDVILPETTSDRERIKTDHMEAFLEWLNEQLIAETVDVVEETIEQTDTYEQFLDDVPRVAFDLPDEALDSIPTGYKLLLHKGSRKVGVADKKGFLEESQTIERIAGIDKKRLRTFIQQKGTDDVYIGKTLNDRRAKVVWDLNPDADILNINPDRRNPGFEYEELKEAFGWEELKEVPLERDELEAKGVSDEVIKSVSRDPSVNKSLNLHTEDRRKSVDLADPDVENLPEYIVLFPRHTSPNVTDHLDVVAPGVGVAAATEVQGELLREHHDNVVWYSEAFPLPDPVISEDDLEQYDMIIVTDDYIDNKEELVEYQNHRRHRDEEVTVDFITFDEFNTLEMFHFLGQYHRHKWGSTIRSLRSERDKTPIRISSCGKAERFEEFMEFKDKIGNSNLLNDVLSGSDELQELVREMSDRGMPPKDLMGGDE